MRTIIDIATNDLRVFLVDRSNLVGLLVIPIALTVVIGFVSGGFSGPSRLRVDVLDDDQTALSTAFIDGLHAANSSLVLCPMDNDEEDFCQLGEATEFDETSATGRVEDSTVLALIIIPSGFETAVQTFEPVQVIYLSNENATSPGYIRQAVDAAILRVNGAVVASRVGTDVADSIESVQFDDDSRAEFAQALYDRATAIWEDNPIGVTVELTAGEDDSESSSNFQTGLRQSVPGMGSLFVMFTVLGGMTALIQERNQWTLQRLAVMPISRAQILAGKILGRFLLGILQFLVVFAVGLLLGVNLGNDLLSLVLIVLAYTLTITAFSFALGTRLQNESQAAGFSLLLSMVLASLGGAMWPLEVVPEIMQIVGHVSPVAWAMDSFNTLLFFGGGLGDILLPVGVLLAMTVVLFALAVWRFEYE